MRVFYFLEESLFVFIGKKIFEIPAITNVEIIQFDLMFKSKLEAIIIQTKDRTIINTTFNSNGNSLTFSSIYF